MIAAVLDPFDTPEVDISDLAVQIVEERERTDPNVVAADVLAGETARIGRALYFSRATVPHTPHGPHYHHIGHMVFFDALRWTVLSSCRRDGWKSSNGWSSCVPSKPACGSM